MKRARWQHRSLEHSMRAAWATKPRIAANAQAYAQSLHATPCMRPLHAVSRACDPCMRPQSHDDEAKKIAANAQAFARRYFSSEARAC
jgi:hypothetical protein